MSEPGINIFERPDGFFAWLDVTKDDRESGLCIGTGKTRLEALGAAVETVQFIALTLEVEVRMTTVHPQIIRDLNKPGPVEQWLRDSE